MAAEPIDSLLLKYKGSCPLSMDSGFYFSALRN